MEPNAKEILLSDEFTDRLADTVFKKFIKLIPGMNYEQPMTGLEPLWRFLGGDEFMTFRTFQGKTSILKDEGLIHREICGPGGRRKVKFFWYPSTILAYRQMKSMAGKGFFEK